MPQAPGEEEFQRRARFRDDREAAEMPAPRTNYRPDQAPIRAAYARQARLRIYDPLLGLGFLGSGSRTRRRMVEHLGLAAGDPVLDIGCGTGLNFEALEEAVGPGGQVVGLDATPEMLELAEARLHRRGWRNVHLVEDDAAALPFEDRSFAAACSTLALSGVPEWRRALSEAWRVTMPGGRLAFIEASRLRGPWRLTPLHPLYRWLYAWQPPGPDVGEALAQLTHPVGAETALGGIWMILWVGKD
jgi:ubiquinone/menaquinone biosynthesis C-methylase UbiE